MVGPKLDPLTPIHRIKRVQRDRSQDEDEQAKPKPKRRDEIPDTEKREDDDGHIDTYA